MPPMPHQYSPNEDHDDYMFHQKEESRKSLGCVKNEWESLVKQEDLRLPGQLGFMDHEPDPFNRHEQH